MSNNSKILNDLATSSGLANSVDVAKLQMNMGFQYRLAIGKLLFAAVTCRPDILFPTILLSQHSTSLAACHYKAVKGIFVTCDILSLMACIFGMSHLILAYRWLHHLNCTLITTSHLSILTNHFIQTPLQMLIGLLIQKHENQ